MVLDIQQLSNSKEADMKKVFIIGTHGYRNTNPMEVLLENGISTQYMVGEALAERFEVLMNAEFVPDAIILSEPLYANEYSARPAILECIKKHKVPTLVLGPISWRIYIEARDEHVHFHTVCSLSDLVKWVQHVCP